MTTDEFLRTLLTQVEQALNKLSVIKTRIQLELDVLARGAGTTSAPSESEPTPSPDA